MVNANDDTVVEVLFRRMMYIMFANEDGDCR